MSPFFPCFVYDHVIGLRNTTHETDDEQFLDMLKPFYGSVDLTQVEFSDKDLDHRVSIFTAILRSFDPSDLRWLFVANEGFENKEILL